MLKIGLASVRGRLAKRPSTGSRRGTIPAGGPKIQKLGCGMDMHDNPVSFDARRYHKVEPHEGSMWALAAYVPQAYARATEQHGEALEEAGFPLPKLTYFFDPQSRNDGNDKNDKFAPSQKK